MHLWAKKKKQKVVHLCNTFPFPMFCLFQSSTWDDWTGLTALFGISVQSSSLKKIRGLQDFDKINRSFSVFTAFLHMKKGTFIAEIYWIIGFTSYRVKYFFGVHYMTQDPSFLYHWVMQLPLGDLTLAKQTHSTPSKPQFCLQEIIGVDQRNIREGTCAK